MHDQAYDWVAQHAAGEWDAVLEIGSRNLNGSIRELFSARMYWGIDIEPGPGVDEVADAATWMPPMPFDVVVCCEVFEHTPDWPAILETAGLALKDGGRAILTMAAPPRKKHSGRTAGPYVRGEYYRNVRPLELIAELEKHFSRYVVDYQKNPGDVRVLAFR